MDSILCMATRAKSTSFRLGRAARISFLSALAVAAPLGAAHAELLGGGGLGLSVGVSVGGSGGVNAGVGVSAGGGSGVNADVGLGLGGTGAAVGVDVSLGDSGGSPGTGGPGAGGPGTGGPGIGPVDPSTVNSDPGAAAKGRRMLAGMTCARGGNSQVYNGFSVFDRTGQMVGWVHDASLTSDLKIATVHMQTVKNACVSLNGGSYAVNDGSVTVNMDGSRFR